jgi:hypothetical protein
MDLDEDGFRPCRCGRRTFWRCEDSGRPACPECASVEIVRLGTRNVLYRMCARCRFEYSSPDLLGTLDGLWTALWRRIEAEDPSSAAPGAGAARAPRAYLRVQSVA